MKDKKIIDDLVKLVDQTTEQVTENIDESLKKNGYDNITDLVSEGINSVFSDKKSEKPYSTYSFIDFDSRKTYIIESLSHIVYDRKYRGIYKEGHEKVISDVVEHLQNGNVDLYELELEIKQEIRILKKETKNVKNKYKEGQLDALDLILKQLNYSKKKMMRKIQMELIKN